MPPSRSPPRRREGGDYRGNGWYGSGGHDSRRRDDAYGRERGSYSGRGGGGARDEVPPRSHPYDDDRRTGGRGGGESSSRPRARSRSPNFARDRERERRAYDERYGGGGGRGGKRREREAEAEADGPAQWGPRDGPLDDPDEAVVDDEPDFEPSGLLAAASNNKDGTALKHQEPTDSRPPGRPWRLYVFKAGAQVDMLLLARQSCYLLGRDRAVVDIHIEHPSSSKQHAVLQFRLIVSKNEFGDEKRIIKPFLMDLDSANGSSVNEVELPPSRYYELKSGDTLRFGASSREYVLIDEKAATTRPSG